MKRVIICEGFNDGLFMDCLLRKIGLTKFKLFLQKDVSPEKKNHAETTVLKSFFSNNPYNPYDILVKLENGIDPALKLFSRELLNYLQEIDQLILMVDLDTPSFLKARALLQRKQELLKQYVNTHFQSTPLDLNFSEENTVDALHHSVCNVIKRGINDKIGEFHLVVFNKNLETACGIIKKKDDNPTKTQKMEKFIVDQKIIEFFSRIFLV